MGGRSGFLSLSSTDPGFVRHALPTVTEEPVSRSVVIMAAGSADRLCRLLVCDVGVLTRVVSTFSIERLFPFRPRLVYNHRISTQ